MHIRRKQHSGCWMETWSVDAAFL